MNKPIWVVEYFKKLGACGWTPIPDGDNVGAFDSRSQARTRAREDALEYPEDKRRIRKYWRWV